MKTSEMTDKKKNQRGLAVVEFAVSLPLVLTLTLGIAEFGVSFHQNQVLTEAARNAARQASRYGSPRSETAIRELTEHAIERAGLDPTKAIVTVIGLTGEPGEPVEVRVAYPAGFTFLSSFFSGVVNSEEGLMVAGVAAMELE